MNRYFISPVKKGGIPTSASLVQYEIKEADNKAGELLNTTCNAYIVSAVHFHAYSTFILMSKYLKCDLKV